MLKKTGTMKSSLTSTPNLKKSESSHANNIDAHSNLSAISSAQTSTSNNCTNEDIIDSLTPHFKTT